MEKRLTAAEYWRRREREALAARRQSQEKNSDPLVEQALIAWMAAGATVPWEQFKREWIQQRG